MKIIAQTNELRDQFNVFKNDSQNKTPYKTKFSFVISACAEKGVYKLALDILTCASLASLRVFYAKVAHSFTCSISCVESANKKKSKSSGVVFLGGDSYINFSC